MKRNLWRGAGIVSVLVFALLLLHPVHAEAQAEGPRVYLLAPVDMNVLVGTYMNMSSNFNFAGTILIKDADISSDVGVVTYMRYFSIGGHFAQLWVAPVWGSVPGCPWVTPSTRPGCFRPPTARLSRPTTTARAGT